MTRYVVLAIDTDEDRWDSLGPEEKQRSYDADARFVALLAERGGRVVGGQELTHSRHARSLSHEAAGSVLVTDGPFAETVEQVSGFYVVECDSLDDLTEAAREMVVAHHRLEIRPVPEDG
jgi:hypothetical protein